MERYCQDPGELVEICLHCERERCEGECAEFMAARRRWTKAHGRKKPMIELGGRMMSVSDFARACGCSPSHVKKQINCGKTPAEIYRMRREWGGDGA